MTVAYTGSGEREFYNLHEDPLQPFPIDAEPAEAGGAELTGEGGAVQPHEEGGALSPFEALAATADRAPVKPDDEPLPLIPGLAHSEEHKPKKQRTRLWPVGAPVWLAKKALGKAVDASHYGAASWVAYSLSKQERQAKIRAAWDQMPGWQRKLLRVGDFVSTPAAAFGIFMLGRAAVGATEGAAHFFAANVHVAHGGGVHTFPTMAPKHHGGALPATPPTERPEIPHNNPNTAPSAAAPANTDTPPANNPNAGDPGADALPQQPADPDSTPGDSTLPQPAAPNAPAGHIDINKLPVDEKTKAYLGGTPKTATAPLHEFNPHTHVGTVWHNTIHDYVYKDLGYRHLSPAEQHDIVDQVLKMNPDPHHPGKMLSWNAARDLSPDFRPVMPNRADMLEIVSKVTAAHRHGHVAIPTRNQYYQAFAHNAPAAADTGSPTPHGSPSSLHDSQQPGAGNNSTPQPTEPSSPAPDTGDITIGTPMPEQPQPSATPFTTAPRTEEIPLNTVHHRADFVPEIGLSAAAAAQAARIAHNQQDPNAEKRATTKKKRRPNQTLAA